jgi:hypothetical protein
MTGKIHTVGTRAQVWHGTSKKTSGGLTKSDLMMNKAGRIVSKAKHNSAKKEMRLLKHGYGTQKGKFGFVKVGSRKQRKASKKMKGGQYSLSPMELGNGIDGAGVTDYSLQGSVGVQERAGASGGGKRSRGLYGGDGYKGTLRGGSGMMPLAAPGSASWAGDSNSDVAFNQETPLERALMAGGRGRSRGRTRGQGRGRSRGRTRGRTRGQGRGRTRGQGRGQRGGTDSVNSMGPSSTDVQFRAGNT